MDNGVCQEKPKKPYTQNFATIHHAELRKLHKNKESVHAPYLDNPLDISYDNVS